MSMELSVAGIEDKHEIGIKIRDLMINAEDLKLNVGCGGKTFDGLINIDLNSDIADVKADAKALPYPDNSCGLVFNSNLLEHFDRTERFDAIKEWHRVLKPNGLLITAVPDDETVINIYKDHLHIDECWNSMMLMIFGIAEGPGMTHRWGYNPRSLWDFIETNGFKVEILYQGMPVRPTPNMTIIARAIKNGGKSNE